VEKSDYVEWVISRIRPRARFVSVSHTDEFMPKEAEIGTGFSYVSLYDEEIASNVIRTKNGIILIDNSYLSSFAYNLALSRVYAVSMQESTGTDEALLLRYNLKKFYGEQLFSKHNDSFSRAVLLETLLYEEKHMRPVFASIKDNADFQYTASTLSQIMSSLVVNHEMGHYYLDHSPEICEPVFLKNQTAITPILNFAEVEYGKPFATEVKCDVIAVYSVLHLHEKTSGLLFCLRAIAFGFAAFAATSSLAKSAAYTAASHRKIQEEIDLTSIKKTHIDFDYAIGKDLDFIERAKLVIQLCANIAQVNGMNLFSNEPAFPLQDNILDHILSIMDQVMESSDPLEREMALLVSQGFHGHPDGIDYLYLRSKVYTSYRDIGN